MTSEEILGKVKSGNYDSLADKLESLSTLYHDSGIPDQIDLQIEIIEKYLSSDENRNYGIHICGKLKLEEAAPKLMQILDKDIPSQDLEAAILALGDIKYEPAYSKLEKYVGFSYNHQALISLSNIDFKKTASYLNEQIDKNVADGYKPVNEDGTKNELLLTMECVLSDMIKNYCNPDILENLKYFKTDNPEKKKFLVDALRNITDNKDFLEKALE